MKPARILLTLLVTLSLLGCQHEVPGLADALGQMPAQGPGLYWQGEAGAAQLGDETRLTLWFRPPGAEEAAAPDPVARYAGTPGLRIRAAGDGQWLREGGGPLYRQDFVVQWLRPGTRTLPPLEFAVGEHELRTVPLEFEVAPGLPPDADPAPELGEDWIADPPAPPLWPWLLLAGAVLLLAGVLSLWLRRRARRPARSPQMPSPPPRQVALGRLSELEQRLDRGEIDGEELVVECALVLRSWLQHGLGLHALERTTEEFLLELGGSGRLPRELQHRLAAFLEDSDLVKFAGQHAHLGLCRSLLQRARDFVETTASAPSPPASTSAAHTCA